MIIDALINRDWNLIFWIKSSGPLKINSSNVLVDAEKTNDENRRSDVK